MLQTPKMIAVKIVKWIIAWKNTFCWSCEGCEVGCWFLSCPPISSRTEGLINTAWLPSTVQNGGLWSRFFRDEFGIAGTSETETSMSGKAECSLGIGEDKKVSFLEWPPLNVTKYPKYFFAVNFPVNFHALVCNCTYKLWIILASSRVTTL